MKDQFSER